MTDHCEYCQKPLAKSRRKRRFCPAPSSCRQAWHRENSLPGVVTRGPVQIKSGEWQFTVRYSSLPPVRNGDRVVVLTADISRPEPSSGDKPSAPIQVHQEQESVPSPAFPVYLK